MAELIARKIEAGVARTYDEEASGYSQGYSDWDVVTADLGTIQLLRDHCRLNPQASVLDIGAGDFWKAIPEFMEIMLGAGYYLPLDISRGMLLAGFEAQPQLRGTALQGTMRHLPYKGNIVDAVISTYGPPSYVIDAYIPQVVSEIQRVAKSGSPVALMPYPMRLGAQAATGFSTSTGDGGELFYNEATLRQRWSPLIDEVVGINYTLHLIKGLIDLEPEFAKMDWEAELPEIFSMRIYNYFREKFELLALTRNANAHSWLLDLARMKSIDQNDMFRSTDLEGIQAELAQLRPPRHGAADFHREEHDVIPAINPVSFIMKEIRLAREHDIDPGLARFMMGTGYVNK